MKISEHQPLLWYLGVVAVSVIVLIYTGLAFTIPFTVPVTIGTESAIFGYYLYVKKKPKTDRLIKEMEKLVAPMYSKIGDINVYLKGDPGYKASNDTSVQEYFRFWDEVKQSKYLAPDYLRSAIDTYLKNKSQTVGDRTKDESYEKAETKLFEAIKRRYSELEQLV